MKTAYIYCEQSKDGILSSVFQSKEVLLNSIQEQFMLSESDIIEFEKNNKIYLDGIMMTITEVPYYDSPTADGTVRPLNVY